MKMTVGRAMKAKRVIKVAKGRLAKALVFKGVREKTSGGLKQDTLMRNKRGKIVSKRKSACGKRAYRQIEGWTQAVMSARDTLHIKGFVAINGKSLQGKALYFKSKAVYVAARGGGRGSEVAAK